MRLNSDKGTYVKRLARICITLSYLFLFISGGLALGQEQFEKPLQENEHMWHPNVKGVGCDTQVNKQPHDLDTALLVKCSILFADGSSAFSATLRFCPNFQSCDAAGGKFKDLVVGILKKKIVEQLSHKAKK